MPSINCNVYWLVGVPGPSWQVCTRVSEAYPSVQKEVITSVSPAPVQSSAILRESGIREIASPFKNGVRCNRAMLQTADLQLQLSADSLLSQSDRCQGAALDRCKTAAQLATSRHNPERKCSSTGYEEPSAGVQ